MDSAPNTPLMIEKPDLPTPAEMRKLRKQFVTVQHPKVAQCGHKIDLSRRPNTNCESCLFTWFNEHGEICQQLDEMHTAGADDMIIQLQGVKFYKSWRKFMATVAQWEKVSDNV